LLILLTLKFLSIIELGISWASASNSSLNSLSFSENFLLSPISREGSVKVFILSGINIFSGETMRTSLTSSSIGYILIVNLKLISRKINRA